jgi:hypothetical protein
VSPRTGRVALAAMETFRSTGAGVCRGRRRRQPLFARPPPGQPEPHTHATRRSLRRTITGPFGIRLPDLGQLFALILIRSIARGRHSALGPGVLIDVPVQNFQRFVVDFNGPCVSPGKKKPSCLVPLFVRVAAGRSFRPSGYAIRFHQTKRSS